MKNTSTSSRSNLQLRVANLEHFTEMLMTIAGQLPDRTTLSQLTTFLAIATKDIKGQETTMVDLKDSLGEALGKSLHTTYQIFLDRELKRNDRPTVSGVGWITQEPDRKDYRRKYLRLTPEGRSVMMRLCEEIEEMQHGNGPAV